MQRMREVQNKNKANQTFFTNINIIMHEVVHLFENHIIKGAIFFVTKTLL